MQISVSDTETELKTDFGIDTMQSFLKLEVNKNASFKLLLCLGFLSVKFPICMNLEFES